MSAHWSERPEGGGRFAMRLISFIGLRCGRACARLILYPISLYFFLRRGSERRASRAFLTRAFGHPVGDWAVLRHIHRYAGTILDRAFMLTQALRPYDLRVQGLDQIDAQLARGRGALLLGAHIGSFEVLRVLCLQRPELRVRVVMDRQQTAALTTLLHALNPAIAANVIDAGQDPTTIALVINEAAQHGELIGLLGDRARPGESTQVVPFFGIPAAFPVAPYLLASVLGLPIVLCFGLFRGGNRYDLYFETFAQELSIVRRERQAELRALVARFAARLEHYTRLDPYNWFNLYDFWHCQAADERVVGRKPGTSVGGSG